MKMSTIFLTVVALFGGLTTEILTQETGIDSNGPRHAINMCPIAVAFGIFSVNYEYLINPSHGVVARFDYEAVPSSYSDAEIEASGKGMILNYRRHLSGSMASTFIGAYVRYRVFQGSGTSGATGFDATVSEGTVGINAGKRWTWNSGLNLTFGLGYGFYRVKEEAAPTSASIATAVSTFRDEYAFFNPSYGELSVGYAF